MKIKMLIACLTLCSCSLFAQHDHAGNTQKKEQNAIAFKDAKLGSAYDSYLHLKDALVASNGAEAKSRANELKKALSDAKASAASIELAAKIAGISNLDDQRKLFSTLSDEMKSLVKDGKLSAGMIYLEYCPMANKNTGAFWLSNEKEIKNPYFGDAMLKCGSVKEMIH